MQNVHGDLDAIHKDTDAAAAVRENRKSSGTRGTNSSGSLVLKVTAMVDNYSTIAEGWGGERQE